jgi:hypothetical protein
MMMKYNTFLIFSQAMAFSMAVVAGTPQTSEEHGKLACGDVIVESETHYVNYSKFLERQVEKQVISITAKNGSKTQLLLDSRGIRKPTFGNKILLDSRVTAWACLKAKDGQNYIFLWYTCISVDERGFCDIDGRNIEWERLFKTDGKALTASYKRNYDKRYKSIYKKLGLEDVIENLDLEPLVAEEFRVRIIGR